MLDQELKGLWDRRADVTRALSAAAAEGDRSENAEYIYRKKELREIDYRIRYLQKRLPELTIVDQQPSDTTKVYFGAWVELEDENGESKTYRIVGSDEINQHDLYISMDSPLAKALLKRSLDDEVSVNTPGGQQQFVISNIEYQDKPSE